MTISGKLGRKATRSDPRTLRLASYLPKELPPAPDAMNWMRTKTDWGQMANDRLGDCTIAAVAHAIQVWYNATGNALTYDDQTVVGYYERWAGYDPSDPDTDQGAVELDILNRWRKEGFGSEKLIAYADPDPHNAEHVKQAIYRFGLVYIGLALPLTAQGQDVWDYVPKTKKNAPWSWGGHAVVVPRYDEEFLYCITWGQVQKMTWRFWQEYCEESHALLSEVWKDRATSDFNLPNLESDLSAVTS